MARDSLPGLWRFEGKAGAACEGCPFAIKARPSRLASWNCLGVQRYEAVAWADSACSTGRGRTEAGVENDGSSRGEVKRRYLYRLGGKKVQESKKQSHEGTNGSWLTRKIRKQ
jgi:hypothetical protein